MSNESERKYKAGLVGEVDDNVCYIYLDDFARISVHCYLDEFGNRLDNVGYQQREAQRIVDTLNIRHPEPRIMPVDEGGGE